MTWLPQTVASREIKSWQNTRQFGYASVRNLIVRIGIIMYNWHMVCYHVYIRCRCTLLNTRSSSCALSVDLLQRFWVPQVSKSEKKIHIIWGHIIAYCHMYFTKHTNGFMFHAACLCTIQLLIAKHRIFLTIYLTPWSQIDRSNWARESIIQARVSKTTAVYIFLATRWRNYLFTASLVQFWPNQHELFELLLFRARLPSPSHVGLESSL